MSRKSEIQKKRNNQRGAFRRRKKKINIFKVIRLLLIIILIVAILFFLHKNFLKKKIDYSSYKKYYEQTDYNSGFRSFNNSLFINRINNEENNITEKKDYNIELSSILDYNEESYILSQLYKYIDKEKIDTSKISLYIKTDGYTIKLNENRDITVKDNFFKINKIISVLEKNNIKLNEKIKFTSEHYNINSKIYSKNSTGDILSNLIKNYVQNSDEFSKNVISKHIKEKTKSESSDLFELKNRKLSTYIEEFISYNQSKYKNDLIYSGVLDNKSEYFLNNYKPSNFINIISESKKEYLEIGKYSYKTDVYYSIYTNDISEEVIKNIGYIIINSIDKIENIRTLYY